MRKKLTGKHYIDSAFNSVVLPELNAIFNKHFESIEKEITKEITLKLNEETNKLWRYKNYSNGFRDEVVFAMEKWCIAKYQAGSTMENLINSNERI